MRVAWLSSGYHYRENLKKKICVLGTMYTGRLRKEKKSNQRKYVRFVNKEEKEREKKNTHG